MKNKHIPILQLAHGLDLPLPQYSSVGAAGVDLHAAISGEIIFKPQEIKLVPTAVAIHLPENYEAQIRPRSGLALQQGITILNAPGTIDSDYRGEIHVLLIHHGREDFVILHGMRIAQMVITQYARVDFTKVDDIATTKRGQAGFGSTGI